VRWYRARKPLFFFLAFFFVALIPTSNLVILIGSIMAERFVYLPSIGLAGCVVAAICALGPLVSRQRLRTAWIALGVLCLACAVRTYARNFDWLDDLSLWTSGVDVCPGSAKAHYNLGHALSRLPGELPDAIVEYQVALRIDPEYATAHLDLGNALSQLPGRLPDAIAEYRAALRIDPAYAEAHNNLGLALANSGGRWQEAIAEYQAALRLDPNLAAAHDNLGLALANSGGRWQEAITEYQAALRIKPDQAEAHFNLGNALSHLPGRMPEAITEYEAALRITPDSQLRQMVNRLRAGGK
jgi:tetratricopeptide (TPR) repeat protein